MNLNIESNFHVNQTQDLLNNKQKLVNNIELDKINNNGLGSISDSIDYLGCLNNNCSKLDESKISCDSLSSTKKIDYMMDNLASNDSVSMSNKPVNSITSVLLENLDMLVSYIYIFLITLLLLNSAINKSSDSLIQIIILSLLYVFYKMFMIK